MAWKQQLLHNRPTIWRAVNGVIERKSIHAELRKIEASTLVAVGDQDVATVPAQAASIAAAIDGAKLVIIPGAGHGLTLEAPAAVTDVIAAFLEMQEAISSEIVGLAISQKSDPVPTSTSRKASVNGRAA